MRFDPNNQPLHRHDEARLIVFLRGCYIERAIEGSARFEAGGFIVRPALYAHDGCGTPGTEYRILPVSPTAWARYHADNGWTARIGRIPDELAANNGTLLRAGDAILANCETRTLAARNVEPAISRIALALAAPGSSDTGALAAAEELQPWTLTRRFRRQFGITPTRFRQESRIQLALKLMAETALSLSAISAEAGFADQSHLSRSLRQATGGTPSQIQRSLIPS